MALLVISPIACWQVELTCGGAFRANQICDAAVDSHRDDGALADEQGEAIDRVGHGELRATRKGLTAEVVDPFAILGQGKGGLTFRIGDGLGEDVIAQQV